MARTVSVKLRMEVAEYIANGGRAEEMLVEIGDAAKVAADKGTKGAKERSAAELEAARILGKAQSDGLNGYQALGKAIDDEKAKLVDLRREYGSNTGGNASIFGDIQQAEHDLRNLESLAKTVGLDLGKNVGVDLGKTLVPQAAQAGEDAGTNFLQQFGSKLSLISDNPYVAVAGAAIGATLAVPLLAAVEGAVGAGIGAGGIAVGIAASLRTPQVQNALMGLEYDASSIFADIGHSFAEPVAAGVGDIDKMIKEVGPDLKATFAAIAPDARVLIDGVGGFVTGMLPGLEEGFRNAQPLVEELARDLPQLGADVGTMIDEFTEGGPGAADALHDLLIVVGDLAKGVGTVFEMSSKTFRALEFGVDVFTGRWGDTVDLLSDGGTAADDLTPKINGVAEAFATGAQDADRLNFAFNKWITSAENADNALLALDRAQLTFNTDLTKGTKAWDEHTKAGQKNVGNLNSLVQAMTRVYDAKTVNGQLSDDDAKKELAYAESLYAIAKAAGATGPELNTLLGIITELKGELAKVPPTTTTKVTTPGLDTAYTKLNDYISAWHKLMDHPQINLNIHTSYTSDGSSISSGMGRPGSSYSAPHATSQPFGQPMGLGQAASSYGTRVASGGGGGSGPVHLTVQLVDTSGRVTRSALIQDALNRGIPQPVASAAYP